MSAAAHFTEVEMNDLLAQLDARERRIIENRVLAKKTLQTVADDFGVTRERVRQIERDALLKLRALAEEVPLPKVARSVVEAAQKRARIKAMATQCRAGIKWAEGILSNARKEVAHILIARPDKAVAAQRRLAQAGIYAKTLPSITPTRLSEGMAQMGYARFAGGAIPRTPAQHGAGLSHLAALSMGRALQKDWVFIWEEDVEVSPRLKWWPKQSRAGFKEGRGFADRPAFDGDPGLKGGTRFEGDRVLQGDPSLRDTPALKDGPRSRPPAFSDWEFLNAPDLGVIYLGGILWGDADSYGERIGASELWRVTRGFPISCTHAVGIHARAMGDVIESCSRLDMTIDDCVSRACIDATTRGSWSTWFARPWLAWQLDREETKPNER